MEAVSAENPVTPEKIALGKVLFHDPQLSRDGSVSCSSCHALDDYGMDGLALASGIDDKIGTRNSPSVFNAALQDSQFWDGRAASVEAQARGPLLNPVEMDMPDEASVVAVVAKDPRYQSLFAQAFPDTSMPISFTNTVFTPETFQYNADFFFSRIMAPGGSADISNCLFGTSFISHHRFLFRLTMS